MSIDLLSNAHASELDWDEASFMLRNVRVGQVPFVYFIGEENDGAVKIGHASDPIKRLRSLQTGNPRRLKIERLVYGDLSTEKILHEYWREFVIGGKSAYRAYGPTRPADTEWFAGSARGELFATASEIAIEQAAAFLGGQAKTVDETNLVLNRVMTEMGRVVRRDEELRYLARTAGYVTKRIRA